MYSYVTGPGRLGLMVVVLVMPVYLVNGYEGLKVDYRQIDKLSDEQIEQLVEQVRPEYERLRPEFLSALERFRAARKAYEAAAESRRASMADWEEFGEAGREYEKIAKIFRPIESDMRRLQDELQRRASIPPEVKEYQQLDELYMRYSRKGEISRQQVIDAFVAFADKYFDRPLGVDALYDAAMLYNNEWRDANTLCGEPARPEKTDELLGRVADTYPDLLYHFVIAAKHHFACKGDRDEHFARRLEFYRWTLDGIKPQQYIKTIEWMRKDYKYRNRSDEQIISDINGFLRNLRRCERINLSSAAKYTSDPNASMRLLDEVLQLEAQLGQQAGQAGLQVQDSNRPADTHMAVVGHINHKAPSSIGLAYGIGIAGIAVIVCLGLACVVLGHRGWCSQSRSDLDH